MPEATPAPTISLRTMTVEFPLKRRDAGFTPHSIDLSLTPAQARALCDFAEGLRSQGVRINHPADALKHLLSQLAEV